MIINTWVLLGGVVIVCLAAIAAYYQILLFKKGQLEKQSEEVLRSEVAQRKEKNTKSVVILARAVMAKQVTLTEACIRINALIQTLGLNAKVEEELSVFRQLAEATAHIPILERWKALSRKEKQKFESERESLEANFSDFVVAAAEKIVRKGILD